jgi:hypothetical protein
MAGVNTPGVVEYNGYVFPKAHNLKILSEPVQSKSGLATKYHRSRIIVEFIVHLKITPELNTSSPTAWGTYFDNLRRVLCTQGGYLRLYGKASGLTEDGNGYVRDDLNYGPRPIRLDVVPLADCGAYNVTWECELITAPCISFTPNNPFLDYVYSREVTINERGYTQVTTHVMIEVVNLPNPPAPPTTEITTPIRINKTADDYRNIVVIPPIPAFKRSAQRYVLSEDLRTLEITITDVEIESRFPYPKGILDVKATQDVRTASLIAGVSWKVKLDINIELMPHEPKTTAYTLAAAIIKSRREAVKNGKSQIIEIPSGDGTITYEAIPAKMISREFSVRDDIYGNSVSFSVSWDLTCRRSDIFKATAMFQDPSTDDKDNWQAWTTDHNTHVYPRGRAALTWTSNFVAPNICLGQRFSPPLVIQATDTSKPDSPGSVEEDPETNAGDYLQQRSEVQTTESTGRTWTAPLKGTGKYDYQNSNSPQFETGDPEVSNPASTGQDNAPQALIQHRRDHQFTGVARGWATRYGRPIPQPTIADVDGIPVTQVGQVTFNQRIAFFTTTGKPVYRADWAIPFVYNKPPHSKTLRDTHRALA